jgi:hypothetical protein
MVKKKSEDLCVSLFCGNLRAAKGQSKLIASKLTNSRFTWYLLLLLNATKQCCRYGTLLQNLQVHYPPGMLGSI